VLCACCVNRMISTTHAKEARPVLFSRDQWKHTSGGGEDKQNRSSSALGTTVVPLSIHLYRTYSTRHRWLSFSTPKR
jgi:hypothetical protein